MRRMESSHGLSAVRTVHKSPVRAQTAKWLHGTRSITTIPHFPCPEKEDHNCSLTMRSPRSSASTQQARGSAAHAQTHAGRSWSTKGASPIPIPVSRAAINQPPGRVDIGKGARARRAYRRRCSRPASDAGRNTRARVAEGRGRHAAGRVHVAVRSGTAAPAGFTRDEQQVSSYTWWRALRLQIHLLLLVAGSSGPRESWVHGDRALSPSPALSCRGSSPRQPYDAPCARAFLARPAHAHTAIY
jgi:hypothetical protein